MGAEGRREHLTRRRLMGALGAGGVLGGAPLAACSPAARGGEGEGSRSLQPVTLRVNHRTEKYIPERGAKFTAQYPHITVEFLPDSGYEKLIALLAAGDLGDVVWLSTGIGSFFELAAQGHLLPLDAVVAADRYDLKQHFPRAVDVARTVDGKLFGMPNLIHPSHIGVFYNVNLFESTGVKPPTSGSTYDELVETARQIMARRPDVWGIETETTYPPLLCFIRSFGGEMIDPPGLGKRPAIDRGPAKQALQWLYDLRHRHKVHPLAEHKPDFRNGDVAMRTSNTSFAATANQAADKFQTAAVLIPKGSGGRRGSQGHVDMWGIYSRTKQKDAAWMLMRHFVSKEQGVEMYPEVTIPGARPDAWNEFASRPIFKPFKEFMDSPGPEALALPWNLRMLDFQNVTQKALEPLWAGTQSVDATVAAALGPMQQQLDLPRGGG
jgi:ABC-type glycerol-3-phosphate transport system substrate-binding protein